MTITDKTDAQIIRIEITGKLTDTEYAILTSGILGILECRGFKPTYNAELE